MKNVAACISLILALVLSSCSNILIEDRLDTDTTTMLAALTPENIELSGVDTIQQPTKTTCGITAVTIVSNFCNAQSSTVEELISRNNVDPSQGTSTELLIQLLEFELPGRSIDYFHGEATSTLLSRIHTSLDAGNPLVAIMGAPNPYNKPLYDFHTVVIYGIDLERQVLLISNPYGYTEELSFIDFINRMSFSELGKYPIIQQLIIQNKLIDRNMLFVIGNS